MTIWELLFLPWTSPSPSNSIPSPSQPGSILHLNLSPRTPSMKLKGEHLVTEPQHSDTETKWNSLPRKKCLQSATMNMIINFQQTKKKKEDIVLEQHPNKTSLLIPSKPKKYLDPAPTNTQLKTLLISIPASHFLWDKKLKTPSKGIKM